MATEPDDKLSPVHLAIFNRLSARAEECRLAALEAQYAMQALMLHYRVGEDDEVNSVTGEITRAKPTEAEKKDAK